MMSGRDRAVIGASRALFEGGSAVGLDDGPLVDRFLATRDEAAFATLVARHGPLVMAVCRGLTRDEADAEDAFQATFLVLARRMGSIRRRAALPSWLHGVARRIAARARVDAERRRRRERAHAERRPTEAPPGPSPADFAALHEEIARLPASYRIPVILCYLDGMTYEAAARHLDCPLGTLSIRLKRARDRLRDRLTRRGVAVPVALIGVGLIPAPAPAAVPTGLATLAVRTALASIGNKATVGGTVPPAVALLAARMTLMMRLKMIALGLLITGGVALAAAGSLAMQPKSTPPQQAPPAVAPPPAEFRTFMVQFPGGATFEILGISPHPSRPDSWRSPTGFPLAQPPYDRIASTTTAGQGRRVWEIAYRVQPGDKDENFLLQAGPPGDTPHGPTSGLDSTGRPIEGIYAESFGLSADQASCPVRFGRAAGPWATAATSGGLGMVGFAGQAESLVIGPVRQVDGKASITVSRENKLNDYRVRAIDLTGGEHKPDRAQSCGVDRFTQMELEFNLPPAEIKEFRFQTRPFELATVDDVILKPRDDAAPAEPIRKKGAD